MVEQIARKGKFAGRPFYGCPKFPECREIVDIPENGKIKESASNDSTKSFQVSAVDSIETRYQMPVVVNAPANRPNTQSAFHQTIGQHPVLIEKINHYREQIGNRLILASSQWRLDFPFPKLPSGEIRNNTIISVLQKIMYRGSITYCTPHVQAWIENQIGVDFDSVSQKRLREVFVKSLAYRSVLEARNLDSQEEEAFYQKEMTGDLQPWVFPQVSASSLTDGEIAPSTDQRVDFLVCHPLGDPAVVEIDGSQHQNKAQEDKKRDAALEKSGYSVLRISTDFSQMFEKLTEFLAPLRKVSSRKNKMEEDNLLAAFLFLKAVSQFQAVLLEAYSAGFLQYESGVEWQILVDRPSYIEDQASWKALLNVAVIDFINLFQDIHKLILGEKVDIHFKILTSTAKEQEPDLIVSFNSGTDWGRLEGRLFEISDIYIPVSIAQHQIPSATTTIPNPDRNILKNILYFIYRKSDFLEGQWEAVRRTLQGKDTILLLPTGGGKTIAFQLSAFIRPGVCLVIDPLIALIEDQIDNLGVYGIERVVGITSQLSRFERIRALSALQEGHYLFCYIAPERLQMQDFRAALRGLTVISPISVIAIDEAHCVSEWGHDFRVSYLNIARNARNYCKKDGVIPPLVGLTGTASRSVLADLRRELDIMDFDSVITPSSFDRSELKFTVIQCQSDEKDNRLIGFLNALPGYFGLSKTTFYQLRGNHTNSGLVFYPNVNGKFGVKDGFELLNQKLNAKVGIYSGKAPKGFNAEYWGTMKSEAAKQFKANEINLFACTPAYGMGIDKQNIRFTIHMNIPKSIEAFYQEAGRAGRDKLASHCCIIASNDYPRRNQEILSPGTPLDKIANMSEKIPWGERDDISRNMYFHVDSFKGIEQELSQVRQIMAKIEDLQVEKNINLVWMRDEDKSRLEKGVHRLLIVGAVSDYVVDYSSSAIRVRLSGNDSEENLAYYYNYMQNFDQKTADQARRVALRRIEELPHREFVFLLVENLVKNFIYRIIELSRRRALSEILEAITTNPTDEGIRNRILNYLEFGRFSELLDKIRENSEELDTIIPETMQEIGSPNEAAELRGQVARLLESYPSNPPLLLVRALAEVLCRDRNEQIVHENMDAYVSYALSESNWGLDPLDVALPASQLINQVGRIDMVLAQNLVVSLMDKISANREIVRILVQNIEMEFSTYASNYLLEKLFNLVDGILKIKGEPS